MISPRQASNPFTRSTQRAQRLRQTLEVTVAGLAASLHMHMPAGAYRDFYLWAISDENPHREAYLRAVALTQLVNMTVELLDEFADESHWQHLLAHTVPMNVYQIHEVVSDNLAIGLAGSGREDATHALRHKLLYVFNRAMIARLLGELTPATHLLGPLQGAAARISLFEQSLIRDRHRMFVMTYLRRRSGVSLHHLEHAGWASLVANIEAGVDLARSVRACRGGDLVRQGLIGRYEVGNRLLSRETLTQQQLAEVGAYSILVIPTLAYYVTVLAEIVQPLERFSTIVEDGSLTAALYDAALIVRLLNDMGTRLVTLSAREQAVLCSDLFATSRRLAGAERPVTDLLLSIAEQSSLMTRIHKDVFFGEFNVCLYQLADTRSAADALSLFSRNLNYFSRLYAHTYTHLQATMALISERIGDERISRLILRFVRFHETLYSHPYSTDAGEYAI
jgi:hypothetical protein